MIPFWTQNAGTEMTFSPMMKQTLPLVLCVTLGLSQEVSVPIQFTVDLAKKCQVLMLHQSPDRKAKKISTCASIGDKVRNLGCQRAITQEALDAMPEIERTYMAWKHPIWCKVAVGRKVGWVQKQYLKEDMQ